MSPEPLEQLLPQDGDLELLTVKEAAASMRCSTRQIHYYLSLGELPETRQGRSLRIPKAAVGPENVFDVFISESVRAREAPAHDRTVIEHDPDGTTSHGYKKFTDLVLKKLGLDVTNVVVLPKARHTKQLEVPEVYAEASND